MAIVGQDCIAEAIAEMRKDRSPLIGFGVARGEFVWAEPDSSGTVTAAGQTVPPYNYVAHKMVTREIAGVGRLGA